MKPDVETSLLISENEKLKALVQSEGWAIAKTKLIGRMALLDSLTALPTLKAEDRAVEILARANSVQMVLDWLADIEKGVAQVEENKRLMVEERTDSYIRYVGSAER